MAGTDRKPVFTVTLVVERDERLQLVVNTTQTPSGERPIEVSPASADALADVIASMLDNTTADALANQLRARTAQALESLLNALEMKEQARRREVSARERRMEQLRATLGKAA